MKLALYPSCSIAANASRPATKMLYTSAPSIEAFGVTDPTLDSKKRTFATVPHSASNVDS